MLAYGSSGNDWEQEHERKMPESARQIQASIKALGKVMWEGADARRREVCSTRERPSLTNLSIEAQLGERANLDIIQHYLEEIDGTTVHGYIFDSIIFTGLGDPNTLKLAMKGKDVLVSISNLVMSEASYMAFVDGKFGD